VFPKSMACGHFVVHRPFLPAHKLLEEMLFS